MLILKKFWIRFFLTLVMGSFTTAYGQSGGVTDPFVEGGVGARAFGLGQAFVAVADDPTAVYWNPAGLDFVAKKGVTFYYTNLIEDFRHSFVGLVYPTISIGSFGFGWVRYGTGGIEEHGTASEGIGTQSIFDYSQNLFLFSYAKQIRSDLSVGGSLKIHNLSYSLGDLADTGFGLDFGVMYRPDFDSALLRDLSFGASVQNLWSPSIELDEASESSPFNVKLGLAKSLYFGEERNALTFVFDWNKTDQAPMSFHFGSEFAFRDAGKLRVGFNDGQVAFGAGAEYQNFHFDYNFGALYSSEDFSGSHRFSITIEFGKTKSELIKLVEERREREIQLRRDEELWTQHELDYHNNMEEGREMFFEEQDYLGAYVKFNAARDAAEQLRSVAMRLRGDSFVDPEANDRVVTANALLEEAESLLVRADAKSDSVRQEERKQYALQQTQRAIERDLQNYILDHREKGNEFFKNGFFSNAIREWQLVLERIEASELKDLAWVKDVKAQVEKNIENAQNELEGNVQETIRRTNRLVQRGQYRQALDELYKLRGTGLTESEREAVENKISSLQQQLSFDQNYQEGLRYYEAKQWKQAAEAFERALKIKPNHGKAKEYYDNAYARSVATRQEMPQSLRVKFFRGVQMFREGKYQEALKIWEECRQEQPYNKDILESIDRAKERLE